VHVNQQTSLLNVQVRCWDRGRPARKRDARAQRFGEPLAPIHFSRFALIAGGDACGPSNSLV
jgi:hypothetical protein